MTALTPGAPSRAIDRAQWHPVLILAAQRYGANLILGYAFDEYVPDSNGYCGGWTPAAADEIRAAGLHFGCIFTFRDGDTLPTPARCVELAKGLGLVAGDWVVSSDTETGAMPTRQEVQDVTDALEAAAFQVMVYGNAGTLNSGYLTDARAPWVASYVGRPDPAPALAEMPNVGSWSVASWQYSDQGMMNGVDFDLSVHNLPFEAPTADPTTPTEATDMPLVNAIEGNLADPQDFVSWTDDAGNWHARSVNADDPQQSMGEWDDTENSPGGFVPNQSVAMVCRANGTVHFFPKGKDGNVYCLWLNAGDPHKPWQRKL